jgi:hypothetical protein
LTGHRRADGSIAARTPGRLDRHPQSAQTVTRPDRNHLAGDGRVKVKMLVGIDVIERESGRTIRRELRLDFLREADAVPAGRAKMSNASRTMSLRNRPLASTRSGRRCWRQHRPALYQHQMQAHAQSLASGAHARSRPVPPARRP